jgi:ketosteroid isomerase-like protein
VSRENLTTVRQMIEAWNGGDFDAYFSYLDPACEVDWSRSIGPERGVYRGGEEVERLFRAYTEIFSAMTFDLGELVDSGPDVLVPNVGHITSRDGITATARSFFLMTFEQGRVVRLVLFNDEAEARAAIGATA